MEKKFQWTGLLVEPARSWRKALESSGRNASLNFDCVWSKSGETLHFVETSGAEYSTLEEFKSRDCHDRSEAKIYPVKTVSLNNLLELHNAPLYPDYLSIDTEGSEFAILDALDFARFRFRVITCEHNFTSDRERIYALLTSHGYVRKLEGISDFDDWYVLET